MPRDSNGVYSLPSGYLAVTGETIEASQHNPPLEDIANALTGSLPRSGVATMTGNLNMGSKRITALAAPEASTDAATKSYADGLLSGVANITGGAATAYRSGPSNGNTLKLQAYDVDGAAYVDALTLTAADTPTFNLHASFTIDGRYIYRFGGTDVPLADGGTGASLADPGADRLMFWDESAETVTWLSVGNTSTKIDGTTLKTGAEIANFFAHKNSTNQTIANSTDVKVTFGTESFDVGNAFSSSTWTPPAGKVSISVQVAISTGNDNRLMQLLLYKNGTPHRAVTKISRSGSVAYFLTLNVIDDSSGADTYEVYVNVSDSGSPVVIGLARDTFFCGTML